MKQIAIYGKGGIGKSTIAANLSAVLGLAGLNVLQVGCDPKQDSTRLLLEGRTVRTALDYLRDMPPPGRQLQEIVHVGFAGVSCVEAGGPEPGIGCAGRGILSTFELLEQLGITAFHYDLAVYDVLGDVVCGGFAVPLRYEYADAIYIVTSGEFMALYAGNNILRGVRNYEGRGPRMGGILFNQRGLEGEEQRVRRFAAAVGLPIVAAFPRSHLFHAAERCGRTIAQVFPESDLADLFRALAAYVSNSPPCLPAQPLSPEAFEDLLLESRPRTTGKRSQKLPTAAAVHRTAQVLPAALVAPPRRYCSKSVQAREVLHGCAFNGATHTVMQIRDSAVVVHGPRSCAFLSSLGLASSARRSSERRGAAAPRGLVPSLYCSDMDERMVIFGGNASLEAVLRCATQDHPAALVVVTTCAAGIIGDDPRLPLAAVKGDLGPTPILLVPADGDITGDYSQGILDAMITVARELIDPHAPPDPEAVNIVAEKNLANNTEDNYRIIHHLLGALGLRVNCRFIRNCSTAQVSGFLRGRLNLLAYDDCCGRSVREYLSHHYRAPFLDLPFPNGFEATASWLREVAARFGKTSRAEMLISRHADGYQRTIAHLKPALQGKRLFIVAQNHRLDWIFRTAMDLDMEIVKVGILESAWDDTFVTRYQGSFPLVWPYQREEREDDMHTLKPDLTLISYPWRSMPDGFRFDTLPMCPDVGFEAGLALAQRWQRLMRLPPREGWRHDL